MGFMTYDLVLLALFTLVTIIFLVSRKKNLERQGIMYLYKTKVGIRFIDKFAKRFGNMLRPMRYLVIGVGYFLMVSVVWMFVCSGWCEI